MSKKGDRKKKGLGVFGWSTAAMFGIWMVHALHGKTTTTPTASAHAAAVEPVATGGGLSTATVVVGLIVALVVGMFVWFAVGKFRDLLEDRRAAEANRIDQVEQIKARAQREQLAPRVWRYTLTGTTSNGASGTVSDEIVFPSASRIEVKREVLRRAYAKDPQAKLTARVEPVSR